jgi:PKD repeat protein
MNRLPENKILFFFLAICCFLFACKKTETITLQQPTACFAVQIIDPFDNYPSLSTSSLIDSACSFRNCSDSGATISYKWSFGDGTTSTEKNPKHTYSRRGTYSVTLTVSNDDKVFDTLTQTLSVILGQQHISFGDGFNVAPVDIEETSNNEFVLLFNSGYGTNFYLVQMDSLLKQKSMKTFPSNYRLTSMQSTNDGNYIFTGSTQSINKGNELIKMTADGGLLWTKTLSGDDGYTSATHTSDGGYAIVGTRPVAGPYGNTIYNTIVIKTDNGGNVQWEKLLDQEGMIASKDAVIEPDGIVVPGVKRNVNGGCQDCDSLLIVKLNNSGSIVWKNTVMWGLNTSNWWNTRINKLANGNYAVCNEYTRGIFFFSPAGNFLDRKLAMYQAKSVVSSADGNLVVLQSEPGNGNRIIVTEQTLDGVLQWYSYPDGRQKVPGGVSCCSSSWPVGIRNLRNGGTITIGYRVNNNTTGYGIHTVILMLELDEMGKPK